MRSEVGGQVPWEAIRKSGRFGDPAPNMVDYENERSTFSWEAARRSLDGLPGGAGLNIAHEAVDFMPPDRGATTWHCAASIATGGGGR